MNFFAKRLAILAILRAFGYSTQAQDLYQLIDHVQLHS